jgi:hypothetical protein
MTLQARGRYFAVSPRCRFVPSSGQKLPFVHADAKETRLSGEQKRPRDEVLGRPTP